MRDSSIQSCLAMPQLSADQPTRDRLVSSAAELVRRHSYNTVSVDDICRLADVKKGTFYHHFSSKVDLALAAFDHLCEMGVQSVLGVLVDESLSGEERLAVFCSRLVAHHRETYEREGKVYGCPLANAGQEMAAQDERIRARIAAIFSETTTMFVRLLQSLPHFATADAAELQGRACEMMNYIIGAEHQAKIFNTPDVLVRDLLPGLMRLAGIACNQTRKKNGASS